METILDFGALKFNHKENIENTEKYLADNPELHQKIDKLVWAYHEVGHVIPQNDKRIFSGHNLAYNESYYEVECSYQLIKLSLYKYAFIALRNALELGLLSIYWDKDDKAEISIQNWYDSKEDTPFKKEISSGLKTIDNIKEFCKHYDLFSRIDKLYGTLSDFNHTRGYLFSGHNLNHANFTRFNEKALLDWSELLEPLIQLLLTVYILKYPVAIQNTPIQEKFGINGPFGGFLEVFQSEQIKEVLNPDELKILQKVSDNDEKARSLADWVNSFPDISDKELKRQVYEFDDFMKSHNKENNEMGDIV